MDDFLSEISRREEAKQDFIVGPKKMMMENDSDLLISGLDARFKINEIAHRQFATKLDIPKTFYDELPRRAPGLRSTVVNGLLAQDKEKRMVRTLDGYARAIVSDRFKPIDNFLVMEAVLPTLKEHKDLVITSLQLSDTRMYMQVIFPKITGEVVVGQPLQYGVNISNSEVGFGSQDVRSFAFVLRCRNGMVGESIMRKYHVGRRAGDDEEDYNVYSNEAIMAELKSFQLRLRDVVRHAVTQTAFNQFLLKMKAATKVMIPDEAVESTVENVTKKYSLSQEDGKQILKNLWKDKDTSKWGLVNAVTALSHTVVDVDKQYEIEKAGNELALIGASGWATLTKIKEE